MLLYLSYAVIFSMAFDLKLMLPRAVIAKNEKISPQLFIVRILFDRLCGYCMSLLIEVNEIG
jgi:hypothetical protein